MNWDALKVQEIIDKEINAIKRYVKEYLPKARDTGKFTDDESFLSKTMCEHQIEAIERVRLRLRKELGEPDAKEELDDGVQTN